MTISRRSLLGGMLALAAAPAIVRASSLMPSVIPVYGRSAILYGDFINDDAPALNAYLNGLPVINRDGSKFKGFLHSKQLNLKSNVRYKETSPPLHISNCLIAGDPAKGEVLMTFDPGAKFHTIQCSRFETGILGEGSCLIFDSSINRLNAFNSLLIT